MAAVVAPEDALRHALADVAGPLYLACSGGRDSVALLHALVQIGRPPTCVLTVDHGLRPESGADARFVVSIAREYGLDAQVLAVAVGSGEGPEDAARRARHGALGRAAPEGTILLAHTADDGIETTLLRLADGAGVRGLAGIPPRSGRTLRPWLTVPRAQVAEYAERHGLAWREDPSNRDPRFRRNRVRAALPALDAALGEAWRGGAAQAARHLAQAHAGLDHLARAWFGDGLRADARCVWVRRARLDDAPASARPALLRFIVEVIQAELGSLGRRTRGIAVALDDLARGRRGRVSLPGGLLAERDPVAIVAWRPRTGAEPSPRPLSEPGRFGWGDWVVDVGGCAPSWHLRARLPGERYVARGSRESRSVARAWSAAGVPRRLRAGLPILADARGPLWIAGLAPAARCPRGAVRLTPGPSADVGARAWLESRES